jgi:hypothetical protein
MSSSGPESREQVLRVDQKKRSAFKTDKQKKWNDIEKNVICMNILFFYTENPAF